MAKDVLIEIGLEELPARFIDQAEQQLADNTQSWFKEMRISFESIASYSTPRRLAVLIREVADTQTTIEEEAKGPAEKIAKDDAGNWTKAAIGFTKGQGKTVDDIYTKEVNGISYIFVKKHIEGKQTAELLPALREIVLSLQFGKNMRWGSESLRYARPIRWLVALYGEQVIPFEIANVRTGNITYGHRFLGGKIELEHPLEYEEKLYHSYVVANGKKREQMILAGLRDLEKDKGVHIPVDESLLQEVRNLVEYPTVFFGTFDEAFLELPQEVLITSMKEHQRYFPVKSQKGVLLQHFVGVRNGDHYKLETVVKGNEKVLRARLSDAQFFFEEDQKQSIDFYLNKLKTVVFQEKLGTYSDKVSRIVLITEQIAAMLQLDKETTNKAIRAAEICKFDLMTNMVNEFTELQGLMGAKYAQRFGEENLVAQAIGEQYLPSHADGELPKTLIGSIVSIADKLDTITGCMYVGLKPTGSQDPYGLRRQAIGVLRILTKQEWDISVEELFHIPVTLYQSQAIRDGINEHYADDLADFLKQRAKFVLKEQSIEPDVMEAVTVKELGNMTYMVRKAEILSQKRNDPTFKPVQEALVRVLNLAKKADESEINTERFATPSEEKLFAMYKNVLEEYNRATKNRNAQQALQLLSKLAEPIHDFFDNNMVMAEDMSLRKNRLALINNIAQMIYLFADLSTIEWKQHF